MSDPVTQVEIEDVLTSIRRLVSENGRPETRVSESVVTPAPQTEEDESPDAADRLVLTPALRVPEVDEAEQDSQNEAPEELAATSDVLGFFKHQPTTESADENDGADREAMADQETDSVFVLDANGPEETAAEAPLEETPSAVEWAAEEFDEDEGIALSEAQELDSRIVQWGRIGQSEEDLPYEPDEAGDSDYAGTDVQPLNWDEAEAAGMSASGGEDAVTPEDFADQVAEGSAQEDWAADSQDVQESELASLQDTPELHKDAHESEDPDPVEFVVDEAEPDDGETAHSQSADTNSYEAFEASVDEVAARLEADAHDFVTETAEAALAPELQEFDPGEDAFLDEAMLRDLVGDIVRQELQGALGERITRNVRKLVRREIHRALAAHELD